MVSQTQTIAQSPSVSNPTFVARSPVFYGWVIWLVAFIGMSATSPGQSFTVSLFIDHYIVDFYSEVRTGSDTVAALYGAGSFFDQMYTSSQTGRTAVSALYGLGTFLAALSLTWVGKSVDRFGSRTVGTIVAGAFGLVLISLSAISGPVTLFLSFIAIRLLGMGSMFLVSSTAVAQWWREKRGWVIGLALVGFALFQRVYLPGLQQLIEQTGWRNAWIVMGVTVLCFVTPIWWLFMRDRPEQFGLLPDNATIKTYSEDEKAEETDAEENWTLAEVRRLPIFWIFIVGRAFPATFGTGLIFHQVSIFTGLGHTAVTAATTFGSTAMVTALVTLVSGRYISRVRPGYVMALQLAMLMLALFLSMIMTESWMLTIYAISFGFIMGLGGTFDGAVWADLFGRLHHGAIRGFAATIFVTGTSIGPIMFGLSFDFFDSYDPVRWLAIALCMIPFTLSFMVNRPRLKAALYSL